MIISRLGAEDRKREEAAVVREVVNDMLKKVEKAVKVLELAKELKLTRDVSHLTRANSLGPSSEDNSSSPPRKTRRSLSIQEELFVKACPQGNVLIVDDNRIEEFNSSNNICL